jgi:hypothetical protein
MVVMRQLRYLALVLALAGPGCDWTYRADCSLDDAIRHEHAKQTHLEARVLRAFVTKTPPKDAPDRPDEIDRWDEWRDDVAAWRVAWAEWERNAVATLEDLETRAIDEAERAIARLEIDGTPPKGEVDPTSDAAAQNYNRLKARGANREGKRRVVNEEIPEAIGRAGSSFAGGVWRALPWWLQVALVALGGWWAWDKYQAIRARRRARELQRQRDELARQKNAAELERNRIDQERTLYYAGARELDQWIEDHVPERIRRKLVKLPNARQVHAVVNAERRRDRAKWVQAAMGEALLSEDERRELEAELSYLGQSTRARPSGPCDTTCVESDAPPQPEAPPLP